MKFSLTLMAFRHLLINDSGCFYIIFTPNKLYIKPLNLKHGIRYRFGKIPIGILAQSRHRRLDPSRPNPVASGVDVVWK